MKMGIFWEREMSWTILNNSNPDFSWYLNFCVSPLVDLRKKIITQTDMMKSKSIQKTSVNICVDIPMHWLKPILLVLFSNHWKEIWSLKLDQEDSFVFWLSIIRLKVQLLITVTNHQNTKLLYFAGWLWWAIPRLDDKKLCNYCNHCAIIWRRERPRHLDWRFYLPESLAPPKGCWPTTEPVDLSFT